MLLLLLLPLGIQRLLAEWLRLFAYLPCLHPTTVPMIGEGETKASFSLLSLVSILRSHKVREGLD